MSKLLTVFGATGQQGGSVIKTFQSTPSLAASWILRAVTRDTSSPASVAHGRSGVEVVGADFTKPETLQKALRGSNAAFVTTLSIDDAQEEVNQAKTIVDACLEANVKHIVWSGVPSPSKVTNGKLVHVDHFESKFKVEEYIESVKGDKMIASYFEPASYFSNIEYQLKRPAQEGVYTLHCPYGDGDKTRLPFFDTGNDTGVYVAALLQHEDSQSINGYRAQAVTQWLTANQVAQIMSDVTGKPFKYVEITSDKAASFMPQQLQLRYKEMYDYYRDYQYYGVGSESKQDEGDRFLKITAKSSLANWARGSKAVQNLQ